jgi:hypothetical protein
MRSVIISIVALSLAGCASSPDEMTASYVSPVQYQSYDCSQIGAELQRVTRRANELYGQLNKTASDDNAQMAVGMILFWPALFFLEGGDGPQATEYSRLKGERDALEQVAVQKHCDPAKKEARAGGEKEAAGAGAARSVLAGQEEGGHAAVGLGDDPEGVVAVALAGLGGVDGISREDAVAVAHRLGVGRCVLGADTAPIAPDMAAEIDFELPRVCLFERAGGGDDLAQREQGGRVGWFGGCLHDDFLFR